jgi:hypothetical protein
MSVQVLTTGDLRRTTNLPVNATGWALGFWFRKTAAIGSGIFETIFELGDAVGNYLKFYLDGTAQDLRWQASGSVFEDVSLFTPTNGTWYFVAVRTASATTADILWRAATATSLSSSTGRACGTSVWTKMFFANNEASGEPTANTELAGLKLFLGTLSDAQVWEQSARLLPRCDAAILDSFLPLHTNSGTDEGGRARNWTVTATLTSVASTPNVARGGRGRGRVHRPSSSSSPIAGALTGGGSLAGALTGAGALAAPAVGQGTLAGALAGAGTLASGLSGTGTLGGTLASPGALAAGLSLSLIHI